MQFVHIKAALSCSINAFYLQIHGGPSCSSYGNDLLHLQRRWHSGVVVRGKLSDAEELADRIALQAAASCSTSIHLSERPL